MSSQSKIPWTDVTWNPVTGCTPISAGCQHCYARTFAERWRGIPGHSYEQGFDFRLWPERLAVPCGWKKARMVFVCSMADLFQEAVPDEFIRRVYNVMAGSPRHIFQILTKRPERLASLWNTLPMGRHIWHGVTVENENAIWRIPTLCLLPSKIRFVSFEPLLGPVYIDRLYHELVKWIIVGGETGPGARPIKSEWIRQLRDTAQLAGIPFFFKQWGGRDKSAELDGRTWKQMPPSNDGGKGET